LPPVSSTLRIPLAARALGDALFPHVAVGDAHAARMLAALGDDGSLWLRDRASVYGILVRTRCFRELAVRFLADRTDGHVVNLGCGLCDYFQWLDNGRARMTDADLPEVLAVRRQLLPGGGARQHVRELDLRQPGWWDALGLPSARGEAPVFLICEGVLMYLQPPVVRQVLRTFGERAPAGSTLAFDALSWLAAGHARQHPSVRHTDAQFLWGPRRLEELTAPSPRLALEAAHPVMEGYGWPYALSEGMFRAFFGVPFYALYELRIRPGI